MDKRQTELWLGWHDGQHNSVELPRDALLRHAMALGSSGSGKTVFCKVVVEECVRQGIPVIAVDPQGDIASLLSRADPQLLREKGIDPALADDFHRRADVVVFTPASNAGIPLCADPLPPRVNELNAADQVTALAQAAKTLTTVLGYDLGSDDGEGVLAVLEAVLTTAAREGKPIEDLSRLEKHFNGLEKQGFQALEKLLSARKLKAVSQRLARLTVGSRRPLFSEGVPLSIEALLGVSENAAPSEARVRIAVIYLNTLTNQDDKDFFVATLVDRLYAWMLKNPKQSLSTLFYIDEIAPFLPPVRKPACKDGLTLLFKQARKYGIGCLMATQNPGDVDYRAMAQFGTWALGRLTTRQDLKKVEPTIKALSPAFADRISQQLPGLRPGQFRILSPDHFEAPLPLVTRWLFSKHQTLDENQVAEHTKDEQRAAFAPWQKARPENEPTEPEAAPRSSDRSEPAHPHGALLPEAESVLQAPAPELTPPPAPTEKPTPNKVKPAKGRDDDVARAAATLAQHVSLTAKELAQALEVGEKKARTLLKTLTDEGAVNRYKEGRSDRYFSVEKGARPDLGLPAYVWILSPQVNADQVRAFAEGEARRRLFGLIGSHEHLDRAELVYRPVIRVDFEEQVEAPLLSRLIRSSPDVRRGSVYYHPSNLALVTFRRDNGLRFVTQPEGYASDVHDFDGESNMAQAELSQLRIDEERVRAARSGADALASFRSTFRATPINAVTVFVPTWELVFRVDGGRGYRVLMIDGLVGRSVEWP